jgi:hypothetical protein
MFVCPAFLFGQVKVTHQAGDWGESGQSLAIFTAKEAACPIETGPQTLAYVVSENGMVALTLNGTCAFHGPTSVLMDFDWKGEFVSFPIQFIPSRNSSNGIWTILEGEIGTITKYLKESSRVRIQATPHNEYASSWTAVFGLNGSTNAINEVLSKHGVTVDLKNIRQGLTKGMYD